MLSDEAHDLEFPRQGTIPEGCEDKQTWMERLQPYVVQGERCWEVRMLWGFVCDALSPELSRARRQCLHALTPAADMDNRRLVLLTTYTYTASQVEKLLLHQIEAQRQKILAGYFEAVQVELVSCLPSWAEEREA